MGAKSLALGDSQFFAYMFIKTNDCRGKKLTYFCPLTLSLLRYTCSITNIE